LHVQAVRSGLAVALASQAVHVVPLPMKPALQVHAV
jgi:hypothetical protein